jgi:hypothetical protein
MNGVIAQYVALVNHGNAFLAGREIPDLLATNSSCQFCGSITLDRAGSTRSANPNLWFQSLRNDGVSGFRLSSGARKDPLSPDRTTEGFIGGGSLWFIEAVKRNGTSDFYTARWDAGDRDAPDRRIWSVSYSRIVTQKTVPSTARSVAVVTVALVRALEQIRSFAEKQKYCEPFVKVFSDALDLLQGKTVQVYHRDLFLPNTISTEASNLLNACQPAWVFGGMGSWNDTGPDNQADKPVYEAVSSNLYHSLTEAIQVAANDSFRAPTARPRFRRVLSGFGW